jgi:hypothetical protein
MLSKDIIKDTGHYHIQAGQITDEGHDLVRHCNDES